MYITAALVLAGGVRALTLIRSKDFSKREPAVPGTIGAPDSRAGPSPDLSGPRPGRGAEVA